MIQRNRLIGALTALLVLITAAPTFSQGHFKRRPVLAPGQTTNWAPVASLAPLALTTQDLTGTLTPTDLVVTMLGSGVTVQNVVFNGASVAAGRFTGGTGIIGFESGIVLSSGDMNSVVGPNVGDGTTTINATGSDPDLAALIPGYTVFDACSLEFDFSCPTTQVISFQFVFASEEFNEYVNSSYNDVFGFFVNGQNIAIVPGTPNTPVSINNVNCNNPYLPPTGSNCSQYINNDLDDGGGLINTEMDGLTLLFTATATINPGLNHIKLAIGDAGDEVLDSNVFIRAGSLSCGTPGPVCELPMPCLELGAGPQVVPVGVAYAHPIDAIATNGLSGQHATVTSVTATLNGNSVAVPANVSFSPALPVTGQPALSSFHWTPTAAQAGTWRFVYHLVDQQSALGLGTVQLIVSAPVVTDALLLGSPAPANIDVGTGDILLVDPTQWLVIPVTPSTIPEFTIPDDPQYNGINFYLQIALYNSVLFPTDPIKASNGLHIILGTSTIESYGPASGITLWSTTPPLLDEDFTVHYTIL